MKRVLFIDHCIAILIFGLLGSTMSAQLITTNQVGNVNQMVTQSLGNDCVTISNVTSLTNGSGNGFMSYGLFDKSGSSFPFNDGFFISTGNIISAGNTPTNSNSSDGDITWTGDSDLETALNISNTMNATVIEFDLISVTNVIRFNYLLASEEYQLDFPCNVADGFALLIRPTGSSLPYENIAVVPDTNTPVGIDTVHPEIVGQCPAENLTYFDGTQIGDTNFEGRTVPLTATASVIPNQSYHLKMVVADQFDFRYDTGVFIESGSLRADIDLGPDLNVCSSTTLDGDVGNPLATYQWYKDGNLLNGANNSNLTITTSGNYRVEVIISVSSSSCIISDDIVVTIDPNQLNFNANDIELCDDNNDNVGNFDLLNEINNIRNNLPTGNYDIAMYDNLNDATNQTNALPNNYSNLSNPQTIYVRVNDAGSSCYGTSNIDLIINPLPNVTEINEIICDDNIDGIINIDLTNFNSRITTNTSYDITYYTNTNNQIQQPDNYTNSSLQETIIAQVTDPSTGCSTNVNININILLPPVLESYEELIDACDQDYDGFATFDITSVENEFTGNLTNISTSYFTSLIEAKTNTNPISNPSSYNNTAPRIQTVFIRVEDTSTGCFSIANIILYTNLLLDGTNVADSFYCDDISNDGIGFFDLGYMETRFINDLENITIEFYDTQSDQLADVNRLDKSSSFQTISNPQQLFLRIISPICEELVDINIGMYDYFEYDPIPNQTYCDEDQDLMTTIDLTIFDNAVRGSLGADYSVSYHLTQGDATNGFASINSISNTTNPFTVYTRITTPLDCSNTQPMQITVLPAPTANTPSPFIICDNDLDGLSIINLNSKENEITTESNRTITYHNTLADAELGNNAITNTSAYNAQTEDIYIRVLDNNNGCPSIVIQSITVNTLPVFPNISLYNLCESDGDGIEDFFFISKDNEILNGQTGKITSYYLNQSDAINRVNPIDKNSAYQNISSPQTIWVRVENISDNSCYGIDSFDIQVNPLPIYSPPSDLSTCDDNNNGIALFDLQMVINEITNGVSNNLNVTFYTNLSDASNLNNPLPISYSNTVNPQPIFARIENDTNCYEIESFELNVIEAPIVFTVSPSVECDDDYDGSTSFSLRFRESEIIGTRPFNSTVSWHTNINDAETGNNPIADPDNFTTTSNPQTVYLRLYNTVSGCYSIGELELDTILPPDFTEISEYTFCANDLMEIDLNEASSSFINPLSADVLITYYLTEQDATNGINALSPPYTYNSTNTSIYARIENINTSCFYVTNFNVRIQPRPVLPAIGTYDMEFCDDNDDGLLLVDLLNNDSAALGNLDPTIHTIRYFLNENDAINTSNEISSFTVIDGTTIYTFVTNTITGCSSIGMFEITIHELPEPPLNTHYIICEDFVTVDAFTGDTSESYLWSTGETTAFIDIYEPGNYTVTITSGEGCTSPPASFWVTKSSSADIEFITKVDFNDPNSITVIVNGDGDYMYVINGGEPQRSNVFYDVSRGYHDIVVIDINGCAPTPSRRVLIIDYPKFFTPNSDGFNDTWQVDGIHTFDEAIFYIYDRHGKLLKNFDKDSIGWDGTYNGNPLPSTDYWFNLKITDSGGDYDIKGHFSLKR